jgi:hypothetical protein
LALAGLTSPETAGTPGAVTLTALDPFGNTATGYVGTVKFTSSDGGSGMSLPGNYTFVAGDDGVHTFTGGVTLVTAGLQTVSGADTADGSVKGSASVNVTAAAASALALSAPGSSVAGSALGLKLTALDPFGNTATGYTGTVSFTTTDTASGASVPGNYTFVAGDDGVHTFTGGVTLVTAGPQTVTATDTVASSLTSSSSILVSTGAAANLVFTAQPTSGQNIQATGSGSFAVSVSVEDSSGNLVSGDDSSVTLAIGSNPGGGVLTCTDAGGLTVTASSGVASFSGCAINETGNGYTLTASDSALGAPGNANPFNITQ